MKVVFLGTRGEIEARTSLHGMHSALLVCAGRKKVMVDCGLDWLGKINGIAPNAIVLTHAHPDHAWGLKEGAPCPVYAPERTWASLVGCEIARNLIPLRVRTKIEGISFEAFPVEHSLRCPAVGYRIEIGKNTVFYSPDVVFIPEHQEALAKVDIYIGDGATVTRSMVRRQGQQLFGHAPIRTQLTWCQKEGVPRAVFTHCGTEIVEGDPEFLENQVRALGLERGVKAGIASDGMVLKFR